jgi:glycerol-3-phosphate acyltransferase PlsY
MAVFAAVFLLDGLKGAGPVLMWRWLGPDAGPALAPLVAAGAAVAGHMFSVFLKFSGGKGVAVGCGVALSLFPLPTLAAAGVFGAVLALTRTVSLGSMVAALSLPGFLALFRWRTALGEDLPLLVFSGAVALVVIWKHRGNIGRILQGTERRMGEKKKTEEDGEGGDP